MPRISLDVKRKIFNLKAYGLNTVQIAKQISKEDRAMTANSVGFVLRNASVLELFNDSCNEIGQTKLNRANDAELTKQNGVKSKILSILRSEYPKANNEFLASVLRSLSATLW